MNKTKLVFVFSFITVFSLGALAMVSYQPTIKNRLRETYSQLIVDTKPAISFEIPDSLPVPPLTIVELPVFSGKLSKDAYEDHLTAAAHTGIGLIEDENQLLQLLENQELVEANFGAGYKIDALTHSYPYLTPHSKNVLEEIGATFQAMSGEGDYFTVSSATRTLEQQKNLKKRNRNAADGNSTHSYGVSFDISYIRFNGIKESNQKAQKKLEAVLNHFQKENKIFVIKERRQACYHITVR